MTDNKTPTVIGILALAIAAIALLVLGVLGLVNGASNWPIVLAVAVAAASGFMVVA